MLSQSFHDFEIIFIDNNSSDGSYDFVKENFSNDKIKFFRSEKNLGFAGGNNFGFQNCSGEYIVLLNNDTVVHKDWLKNLYECISKNENTGIAQSLVITEGIPLKYYEKNGTINILGHNIMEVFEIGKSGEGEIFQANGCSLIIRKKLADEIGGLFDEDYFAYSEDTYLCFKVKFKGLKIMHTSRSVVNHKGGGASLSKKKPFLFFYQERNRLLNFLIFFPESFTFKYIAFLCFNFIMKLTASVFSKKYSASQLVKAYWWLMTNPTKIKNKRKHLSKMKTVSDDDVMKFISGKLFNGSNVPERIINSLSVFYCRLTRIRIYENKIPDFE